MTKFLPKKFHTSYSALPTSQKGQALIILLLIMVVGLTVGLSIATRTITDLRISTQSEESQKAFSAAEAGIEDALRRDLTSFTGTSAEVSPGSGVTYTTTVTPQGNTSQFVTEQPVAQDDVVQVNLDGTNADSVNVYWADENDPASSLEITYVYQGESNIELRKYAYNAYGTSHADNNFPTSTPGIFNGKTYKGHQQIYLADVTPKILRFRPFYGQASIAVVAQPSGSTLPLQSYKITSTGTTGQITREIEVTKSLDALPPIFDYVIYSGQDIAK